MAQIKKNENQISDDADMALETTNGKIIFPDDQPAETHFASEKPAYNVTVVEAKSTDLSKEDLVYTHQDSTHETPSKVNYRKVPRLIKPVIKFALKYALEHLFHPILMFIADISILFFIAPIFIGYNNTVTLVGNLLQAVSTNPIVVGIAAIFVLIVLSPYIFGSGDIRTAEEKKEDERINRIMSRINRY